MPAERPTIRDLTPPADPEARARPPPADPHQLVVGPHNEGARVVLECETSGGYPEPTLTWWRDGRLVDDAYEIVSGADGALLERRVGAAGPGAGEEQALGGGGPAPQPEPAGAAPLQPGAVQNRLIRNRLELASLSRADLLANYSCKAWNSRLGEPPSGSVMIDMNRKYRAGLFWAPIDQYFGLARQLAARR